MLTFVDLKYADDMHDKHYGVYDGDVLLAVVHKLKPDRQFSRSGNRYRWFFEPTEAGKIRGPVRGWMYLVARKDASAWLRA